MKKLAEHLTKYLFIGLVGFSLSHYVLSKAQTVEPVYQMNYAKYEISFARCMNYNKSTVTECKEKAREDAKICVTGCN